MATAGAAPKGGAEAASMDEASVLEVMVKILTRHVEKSPDRSCPATFVAKEFEEHYAPWAAYLEKLGPFFGFLKSHPEAFRCAYSPVLSR